MTYPEMRLKYVASLNNEALGEDTDPDYELQYIDIGNVDSSGLIHEVASYRFALSVMRAALEGRLSFKEAYGLTGLRGGAFQEYGRRLGVFQVKDAA